MTPLGLVVAVSQRVPDCTSAGVAVSEPISYQRAPLRRPPPVPAPTQDVFTAMLCAVHRVTAPVILFLWIEAMNSGSSDVSMFVVDPEAGWVSGNAVVGTARFRLPERVGVPPGLVTRRSTRRLKSAMSGPMKYPSVASGSSLSTPRGANGPAVRWPVRSTNGVTTIGPLPRTLDFLMT